MTTRLRTSLLSGALLLMLAAGATSPRLRAQQIFVPALSQLDPVEANTFSNYPFMRKAGVWQNILAQNEVGTTSATLNKIAFRFDGPSFGDKGGTIQKLEIWLGSKGVDPNKASAIFSANNNGPLTKVVSLTNYKFPADTSVNPDVYGAVKGELEFKFTTPYSYKGGNLVVELRWSGNTNSGANVENCVLDAEEATWAGPTGGAVTYHGKGCNGAKIDARGVLAPGGQITVAATKIGRAAVHVLGLPTSIKLDGLGAPGCELLTTMLGTSVSIADANGNVPAFGRSNTFPMPADTSLTGLLLPFQHIGLHPTANRLGLVTSDQARVTLGSHRTLTRKWYSHFHHNDANAPVSSMSAPVVLMMRFN